MTQRIQNPPPQTGKGSESPSRHQRLLLQRLLIASEGVDGETRPADPNLQDHSMDFLGIDSSFLLAVGQIIMIDILLGGDNAVVSFWPAVACPRRSAAKRFSGSGGGPSGAGSRSSSLPCSPRAALSQTGRRRAPGHG